MAVSYSISIPYSLTSITEGSGFCRTIGSSSVGSTCSRSTHHRSEFGAKEIWCFGFNSMQSVCLHKECPQHCDMCYRIKEIRLETYMTQSEQIPYPSIKSG